MARERDSLLKTASFKQKKYSTFSSQLFLPASLQLLSLLFCEQNKTLIFQMLDVCNLVPAALPVIGPVPSGPVPSPRGISFISLKGFDYLDYVITVDECTMFLDASQYNYADFVLMFSMFYVPVMTALQGPTWAVLQPYSPPKVVTYTKDLKRLIYCLIYGE